MFTGLIVHRYPVVTSTNEVLRLMAEEGAPAWTTVKAEKQTAGRGRRGRSWHSPVGGLYASVLFKETIQPFELPRLPLLAALALYRVLSKGSDALTLKWPNDILLRERKLAGVLVEARTQADRVQYAIMGFGVNIRLADGAMPDELEERCAFAEEMGGHWEAEALLSELGQELAHLGPSLRGAAWKAALGQWRRHAVWGKSCRVLDYGSGLCGRTVDITDDGYLRLETEGGPVTLSSGELEYLV